MKERGDLMKEEGGSLRLLYLGLKMAQLTPQRHEVNLGEKCVGNQGLLMVFAQIFCGKM